MYTAIGSKFRRNVSFPPRRTATSLMAKGGENLRDLPQLIDANYALKVSNYIPLTDGGLDKRKGLARLFTIAGDLAITMLEKYTDNLYIIGYGTKIDVYSKAGTTVTNIKTYTATGTYSGQRYGDYFFVTNGLEEIGRISRTLAYNTQTSAFTLGKKLTGQTSGATGIILENSGTVLTLGAITGTFQSGEIIKDDNSVQGSATAGGTNGFTYILVTGAPICKGLKVIGARLAAFNLKADSSAVLYSAIDTGTNPPFTSWTTGTLADNPGQVNFRNAGTANAVEMLGNNIVVFADNGKWAFYINTIDSAGTLKKVDVFTISRLDQGGARGAKTTTKGLFYVNNGGLWQLISVGQPNVPFSDQEGMTSVLLGTKYFEDLTLTNIDIAYDARKNIVLVTCAKNSSTNNNVIVYNTENKAITEFAGWNINRFMNDKETIYGAGALATTVWTCLSGFDDDGADIWTRFYTELKTGELETRNTLMGGYIQGTLSPSSAPRIAFDIYDVNGVFVKDKLVYNWTPQGISLITEGFGKAPFGSGFGEGIATTTPSEQFDGFKGYIRNYQRIRVNITANDKVPHTLNWLKLITMSKVPIRRRKMVKQ